MLSTGKDSIAAGVMIAIGGVVYLSCDNAYVGAMLFSVALLCICYKGYALFTGRVGYALSGEGWRFFAELIITLAINLLVVYCLGRLIGITLPKLAQTAERICTAKLEQAFWQTLVLACFCGALMYLAVDIFRTRGTPLGVLLCVPVFILSGFEHSIADTFYFAVSGVDIVSFAAFLGAAIMGNAIGSLIISALSLQPSRKTEKNKTSE